MDKLIQNHEIYKNTHSNEILVFNTEKITEAINTRDLFEFSLLFGKHFPVDNRELLTNDEFKGTKLFVYEKGNGYKLALWEELEKDKIYSIWNGTRQQKYLLESSKENTIFQKVEIELLEVLENFVNEPESGNNNTFYYVRINDHGNEENAILRGTNNHFQDTVPNLHKLNDEDKKILIANGLESFVKNHLI